jgi:GT2 family glycosyltransferase
VVVIDNGTPDRSGEGLVSAFGEFTHIRNERNLGFAGGNNVGLRRALEMGVDHALLLNNDAVAKPDFLEPLVACAEEDERVGLVNPKILHADPPGTIWFARGEHSLWTGTARHVDRHRRDDPEDRGVREMTFATGCALLIPRRTLERVGLFDESLFMYAEDLDLSIRVRRAGLKIMSVRHSRVVHREPVRRRKTVADPFRLRLATRNSLQVNWRHGTWWHRLTSVPWFMVRWAMYLTAKNLVLGFPGDALAVWKGVGDALRGRTGPPGG